MRVSSVRFRPLFAAVCAAGVFVAFSTNAQTPPARLGLCAACHGDHGVATMPTVPNLAGQNLVYLRAALAAYRSGARDVPAMRAALSMLSEPEAEQVLAWYAQQKPHAEPAP